MTNIVIRGALIGDADAISHLIIQTLREPGSFGNSPKGEF